uniref:Uncharacterized protein n=1 Tax=Arundo donax TaxID=35708 RepID=A0A0A9BWN5_ARUDO
MAAAFRSRACRRLALLWELTG